MGGYSNTQTLTSSQCVSSSPCQMLWGSSHFNSHYYFCAPYINNMDLGATSYLWQPIMMRFTLLRALLVYTVTHRYSSCQQSLECVSASPGHMLWGNSQRYFIFLCTHDQHGSGCHEFCMASCYNGFCSFLIS